MKSVYRLSLLLGMDNGHFERWIRYEYDQQGYHSLELGCLYGATYDDKINYRCTDKVLMFIERDYSVNNIKPVGSYNQHHLPVKSAGLHLRTSFPTRRPIS